MKGLRNPKNSFNKQLLPTYPRKIIEIPQGSTDVRRYSKHFGCFFFFLTKEKKIALEIISSLGRQVLRVWQPKYKYTRTFRVDLHKIDNRALNTQSDKSDKSGDKTGRQLAVHYETNKSEHRTHRQLHLHWSGRYTLVLCAQYT